MTSVNTQESLGRVLSASGLSAIGLQLLRRQQLVGEASPSMILMAKNLLIWVIF